MYHSKLSHVVGEGSPYDADMPIVETFVRSRDNKDDSMAQTAMFAYYQSSVMSYWGKFKEEFPGIEYRGNKLVRGPELSREDIMNEKIANEVMSGVRVRERSELYGIQPREIVDRVYRTAYDQYDNLTNFEDAAQLIYPLPPTEERITLGEYYKRRPDYEILENFLLPRRDFRARAMSAFKSKEFIAENMDYYEERLIELLNLAQVNFAERKVFRIDPFVHIYQYIGYLVCLKPNSDRHTSISEYTDPVSGRTMKKHVKDGVGLFLKNKKGYHYMFLVNSSGFFGLNTYLYALLSKVFIVGIPDGISEFDGRLGCPIEFMTHDYGHSLQVGAKEYEYSQNIGEGADLMGLFSNVYFTVLNDENITTRKQKELFVLFLWFCLHELKDPVLPFPPDKALSTIMEFRRNKAVLAGFEDEFLSFSPILDSEHARQLVASVFPNFQVPPENYYYIMTMLYAYSYIRSYMLPLA